MARDPNRVTASYLMETALDPQAVAEGIAGEKSSGTFIALPQEDQALKDRSAARVESLCELEVLSGAPLPGSEVGASGHPFRRYAFVAAGARLADLPCLFGRSPLCRDGAGA